MQINVIRRQLIFPPCNHLKSEVVEVLERAENSIIDLSCPSSRLLIDIVEGLLPELLHPLSPHMIRSNHSKLDKERDVTAENILSHFRNVSSLFKSGVDFIRALREANAMIAGCSGELRDKEAGLSQNMKGIQILFPPADKIHGQLVFIADFLNSHDSSVYSAIIALGMILNCHPFSDGNGRVARALYNDLLIRAGARCIFPLHRFFGPTHLSFNLCLREAEIYGDWNPFIFHNCMLIIKTIEWAKHQSARSGK